MVWRKNMKSCKEISMLVSESQDRELTKFESFGLRFHMLFCRHCRRYSASIGNLRSIMGQYSEVSQLPDLDSGSEQEQEQHRHKPDV
jgi:hypothetical protein